METRRFAPASLKGANATCAGWAAGRGGATGAWREEPRPALPDARAPFQAVTALRARPLPGSHRQTRSAEGGVRGLAESPAEQEPNLGRQQQTLEQRPEPEASTLAGDEGERSRRWHTESAPGTSDFFQENCQNLECHGKLLRSAFNIGNEFKTENATCVPASSGRLHQHC